MDVEGIFEGVPLLDFVDLLGRGTRSAVVWKCSSCNK